MKAHREDIARREEAAEQVGRDGGNAEQVEEDEGDGMSGLREDRRVLVGAALPAGLN